jgi:hypothetical protein
MGAGSSEGNDPAAVWVFGLQLFFGSARLGPVSVLSCEQVTRWRARPRRASEQRKMPLRAAGVFGLDGRGRSGV